MQSFECTYWHQSVYQLGGERGRVYAKKCKLLGQRSWVCKPTLFKMFLSTRNEPKVVTKKQYYVT